MWRSVAALPSRDGVYESNATYGRRPHNASGFRTRWLMRSPTHNTHKACHGSLRHLRPPGTAERFIEVARLAPIARALAPSDLTLELRPLRSTIVTRFTATLWAFPTSTLARLGSSRIAGCASFHPRTGMDLPC
jgi:hypothetical protein